MSDDAPKFFIITAYVPTLDEKGRQMKINDTKGKMVPAVHIEYMHDGPDGGLVLMDKKIGARLFRPDEVQRTMRALKNFKYTLLPQAVK